MQTRQGNTLQSLRGARDFINAHPAELPGVTASGSRKKLDADIADLATHVADQSGGTVSAQSGTKRVHALRVELLRLHMAPIAAIASVELSGTKELVPLRMPRGTPSTERLVAAARGMSQVAAQTPDVFINAGLPLDFIARLDAARDALLQAKDARKRTRGKTSGATTGVRTRLREARQTVHILDKLVRAELAGQPVLLKDWITTTRLTRARTASATAAITPPATTTAPVTTAATTTAAPITPLVSVAHAA